MFLAVLPLVVLFQVLPPPAGRIATVVLLHGVGGGRDVPVTTPGNEDCRCGVPDSPRGPR